MKDFNKRINELEQALVTLELVMSNLAIPPATKQGVEGLIKGILEGLIVIKNTPIDPNNVDEPQPTTTYNATTIQAKRAIGDHDLVFKELSLLIETQELSINGKRKYLPMYEFNLLWNLAANNNKPVQFKHNASLQTHLSVLRRTYPVLKLLIETVGRGVYKIHLTPI